MVTASWDVQLLRGADPVSEITLLLEPVRWLCQISALEVGAHEKEAVHDCEEEIHIRAGS